MHQSETKKICNTLQRSIHQCNTAIGILQQCRVICQAAFLCYSINNFFSLIFLNNTFNFILSLQIYTTPSTFHRINPSTYHHPVSYMFLLCDIMLYSCVSVCLSVCPYVSITCHNLCEFRFCALA